MYIGLRDVDFIEKRVLRKLGIKAFSIHEIDKFGIGTPLFVSLSPILQFLTVKVRKSDADGVRSHLSVAASSSPFII